MHQRSTVAEALRLRDEEGLDAGDAAKRLGLSRGTVRGWYAGKLPRSYLNGHGACESCGQPAHDFSELGREYVYLLGLYLGDGTISRHRRNVHRLRIFLDSGYPGIIQECRLAIGPVLPENKVNAMKRGGSYSLSKDSNVEVSVYSKSLPCLFPQHGPGRKHERRIWLADWQQTLAERWPEALLRGMVHSDGCRFINTGRGGWRHPRYVFSNVSTDITSIYCTACDKVGLRWTAAFPKDESKAVGIYVSRKTDVARMDDFIGPKS